MIISFGSFEGSHEKLVDAAGGSYRQGKSKAILVTGRESP
jgi:hypothetical protein